ncbi:MAG: DUF192 domain-containing protein [Leptolyngbyaceae cyanobacterium]
MVQRRLNLNQALGRFSRQVAIWALGILGLVSISCAAPVTPEPIETSTSPEIPPELLETREPEASATPGQILPVSAEVELEDGYVISLEVAETPQQQALGLMHRTSLPDDRGMLFPFDPPRPVSFWMRNVEINLDMIFIRDGVVVDIAANVPPCTTSPCPTYGPAGVAVDAVIELRGERAAELDITVGSQLDIRPLVSENPEAIPDESSQAE